MDRLLVELKLAWRRLSSRPGFTVTAMLSLGFGIGANTIFFSLLNSTLLKPLPVDRPEQLYSTVEPRFSAPVASYPNFVELQKRSGAFAEGVIGYRFLPVSSSLGSGRNFRLWGYLISGNYFEVLGVKAAAGRLLSAQDARVRGGHPVVVISHGCWQKRFGGDPAAVGKTMKVNGLAYTVVGVAPPEFFGTERFFEPEIYLPDRMAAQLEPGSNYLDDRGSMNTFVLIRAKFGMPKAQVQAGLDGLLAELIHEHPKLNSGLKLVLMEPGWGGDYLRSSVIAFNGVLMAVAGALLLVVCVNLASLLLAQASERKKETAIRLAVGASRGQLIRQLLVESILLGVAGGVLGVLGAVWAADAISSYAPPLDFSVRSVVSIDWRVACFSALLTIGTSLLFGLLPAVQSSKTDLAVSLKSDVARKATRAWPLRDILVAGQIMLSVVLLACSALMLRSLGNSMSVQLGFTTQNGAKLGFDLGTQGYSQERGMAFQRELIRRARAVTGVRSAAIANALPLDVTSVSNNGVYPEGPEPILADMPHAQAFHVGDGFFHTLETRLIAGREFEERDDANRPAVLVVNQEFARRILKLDREPQLAVGKRVVTYGRLHEIVGVVEDGKYLGLTEARKAAMFYAIRQAYTPETRLVWRTDRDPAGTVRSMSQLVQELDEDLTIYGAGTLEEHMNAPTLPTRFAAGSMTVFGAITLLLASLGIYGVTAFAMARRTREIGIRMAVGATPGQIVGMIMRRAGLLIGVAALTGGALAVGAAGLLTPMLIGVESRDWVSHCAGVVVMIAVALAACWIPARRAWAMDPAQSLRSE